MCLDPLLCFGSLNLLQFKAAEMNRLPLRRPRGRDPSPDVMTSKNSAWSQKLLLPLDALFSIKTSDACQFLSPRWEARAFVLFIRGLEA